MINLEDFCDKTNKELSTPFSFGDWSVASEGHIAIRVPRRENIVREAPYPSVATLPFVPTWEVEPFPDGRVIVGRGAVVDAVQIEKAQRSQK